VTNIGYAIDICMLAKQRNLRLSSREQISLKYLQTRREMQDGGEARDAGQFVSTIHSRLASPLTECPRHFT